MTRFKRMSLACLIAMLSTSGTAQTSSVGTWQIDLTQSDFGSGPKPRAMTTRVLQDTPQRLAYRTHRVNGDGTSFGWEWSGSKDGVVRAPKLIGHSGPTGLEGVKEVNGILIWHGIEVDGSLFEARSTYSDNGDTMTLAITWKHFDGTEEKQTWVSHRLHQKPTTNPERGLGGG